MCPVKGRGMGKGLLGSDLDSLWLVDGSTIRPLTGLHGGIPSTPCACLSAVPLRRSPQRLHDRWWTAVTCRNTASRRPTWRPNSAATSCSTCHSRSAPETPYGFGLVEQCLIPIMTGLQKQAYQLVVLR